MNVVSLALQRMWQRSTVRNIPRVIQVHLLYWVVPTVGKKKPRKNPPHTETHNVCQKKPDWTHQCSPHRPSQRRRGTQTGTPAAIGKTSGRRQKDLTNERAEKPAHQETENQLCQFSPCLWPEPRPCLLLIDHERFMVRWLGYANLLTNTRIKPATVIILFPIILA